MRRAALWWCGALIFLTAAYYANKSPAANAATQSALTVALVERHTFVIDEYTFRPPFLSIDQAYFNGHYYSDKTPVVSLLGTLPFAGYRLVCRALGRPVDYDWGRYWMTLGTNGLAAAGLAMLVAWGLMRRGVKPALAALVGAIWIAATPLMGYAVYFYQYLPLCVMLCAALLLMEGHLADGLRCEWGKLFWAGILCGLAVWTLNTCGLAALLAGAALVLSVRSVGVAWRRALPWGLGAVIGVVGYFIYNRVIFGGYFSPAYKFVVGAIFRKYMDQPSMGAGWPRPRVMWLITFHKFQGLFLWFPLTALAMAGAVRGLLGKMSERQARWEAALGIGLFVGLMLYVSGFFMWWGGWAYAPRHLIPPLAWLWVGLIPFLKSERRWVRRTVMGIGLAGVLANLSAILVTIHPDPGIADETLFHPETIQAWPAPFWGLLKGLWLHDSAGETLGNFVGLYGRASILPLLLLWGGMLWIWRTKLAVRELEGVGVKLDK